MAENRKAAQEPKSCAASSKRSTLNNNTLRRIKAAIVRLAVWGLLPVAVAEWIIQHGGMRHV
jgi:hypothetical protein